MQKTLIMMDLFFQDKEDKSGLTGAAVPVGLAFFVEVEPMFPLPQH